MVDTFLQMTNVSDNTTIQTTFAANALSVAPNSSRQHECIQVVFSEMEFVPWDNPDNIVSAEVESITRRTKNFLITFLFLIGGPGNVINMAVFYKQGLKDRVNVCLFALAFVDEVYAITCMFMHAEQVYLQFTTGERFGPMITFMTNNHLTVLIGFRYNSYILSAIIASERCYCVLRPLNYQTMMQTRTMAAIIAFVYLVIVGVYFIIAFRFHIGCLYDPETGAVVSTVLMGAFYKAHQQFVDILSGIFTIGLILLVMTVVTVTTIITAVKLRKVVTWRSGTTVAISSSDVVSLTKMLIGSSILFIACVFPTCVIFVVWLLFPEMNSGRRNQNFYLTTLWIGQLFAVINSSFNICVYYAMGTRYRETFWALFGRKQNTERKARTLVL